MTKEELIQHWVCIAETVFAAERNLYDEWSPRLKAVDKTNPIEVEKAKQDYLRAVAEKIVSATPEEDLKKWYDLE